MTSKSQNGKKPKLANHPSPASTTTGENSATPKHKMSFAQHQRELQSAHTPTPLPPMEATGQNLKADAQQHQQKAGRRK